MPDRRLAFLVGLLLAALVTGCAGIPTAGQVIEAAPVLPQREIPVAAFNYKPRAGDDERQIAQGFLNAMTSYTPDYRMAREYLAPEAKDEWDPGAQTQIFDGSRGFGLSRIGDGLVRMSVPLVAAIGSDGSYVRAEPGDRVELDLRLQQVDGEWRIVNPPPGLLLSEYFFDREFDSYDLYFFDPEYQVLVPDPIYLPVRASLSTLLAEALLDGPSRWLEPAVRTAFPPGTRLVLPSVPVVSGTAEVDISSHALAATKEQRDQMVAQLAWTLRQVPDVLRVDVEVGGVPLVGSQSAESARPVRSYQQYDPDRLASDAPVYAIREGAVVSVAGDKTEPVGGPLGAGGVVGRSIAVELRTPQAAVVEVSGTRVFSGRFTGEDPPRQLVTGTDFARPAWDRTGLLWLADRTPQGSRVMTVAPDGKVQAVRTPDLTGQRIETFSLSLDGTRIALLLNSGAQTRVALGLVLRRPEGGLEIAGLREIPTRLSSVLDIGWFDATQLAVLGSAPGDRVQVFIVGIGGATSPAPRGMIGDAVALGAAPEQPLVVATRDGKLLRQDPALRWNPAGDGSSPTYPG